MKNKFKSLNKNTLIALIVSIISAVTLVSVFFIRTLPSMQEYRSAEYRYQTLMNKGHGHDKMPKGIFHYNNNTETPDLATLNKLAKKGAQNAQLRGFLFMPKSDIAKMPVYEGNSPEILALGGGTVRPYETIGKDNFALEAHNYIKLKQNNNNEWFLTKLQKKVAPQGDKNIKNVNVKTNDPVYFANKKTLTIFHVVARNIVNIEQPYASAMLKKDHTRSFNQNKPLITIATCYEQDGILHPKERIVISAQKDAQYALKDLSRAQKAKLLKDQQKPKLSQVFINCLLTLIPLAILIGAIIYLIKHHHHPPKSTEPVIITK